MIQLEPTLLEGRGVRLEQLAPAHADDLAAAATGKAFRAVITHGQEASVRAGKMLYPPSHVQREATRSKTRSCSAWRPDDWLAQDA